MPKLVDIYISEAVIIKKAVIQIDLAEIHVQMLKNDIISAINYSKIMLNQKCFHSLLFPKLCWHNYHVLSPNYSFLYTE